MIDVLRELGWKQCEKTSSSACFETGPFHCVCVFGINRKAEMVGRGRLYYTQNAQVASKNLFLICLAQPLDFFFFFLFIIIVGVPLLFPWLPLSIFSLLPLFLLIERDAAAAQTFGTRFSFRHSSGTR